jgi:Ser/Thr protein kinase RdoA (MazF antagonist)
MGTLHRALARYPRPVPRPVVATAATPDALHRWLAVTERAVADDPDAVAIVDRVQGLVRDLRRQWPDTGSLPAQVVHGDVRLSNICRALDGKTVVFDVGFAAVRPRVHDFAYALVFMARALHGDAAAGEFAWDEVPRLIAAYEANAEVRLSEAERRAIVPLAVAITLYHVAIAGLTEAPEAMARNYAGMADLGAWLLAQPAAVHSRD